MMGQDNEIRAGAISGARARQRRNWTQIAAPNSFAPRRRRAALAARLAAAHAPGVLSEENQRIDAGMRDPASGLSRSRASAPTKLSIQSVGTPMERGTGRATGGGARTSVLGL
jgi:hypothetical protein